MISQALFTRYAPVLGNLVRVRDALLRATALGDRLTVYELAAHLELGPRTARRAIHDLVRDGYQVIYRRRLTGRRGGVKEYQLADVA